MHTELDHNDTREAILVNMIGLKHRLSFLSKVQMMNGEEIKREELSAMFASFSNEIEQIIDTYQNVI